VGVVQEETKQNTIIKKLRCKGTTIVTRFDDLENTRIQTKRRYPITKSKTNEDKKRKQFGVGSKTIHAFPSFLYVVDFIFDIDLYMLLLLLLLLLFKK